MTLTSGGAGQTALCLMRAWHLEIRQLARSRIYLFTCVLLPLIFASIAHYMFSNSPRQEGPLVIALSAGLMGMWSATLMGSGNAINRLRYMQVLEPLVASPTPTFLFALPFALATASLGIYSLGATLLWSALLFGMPIEVASPGLFMVALSVTIIALGLVGLMLASIFILYPTAQSLANLLEYPMWMVSGILVPVSSLPEPVQYVSHVLPPTWGIEAVLNSATGAAGAGKALALCLLLSAACVVITLLLLRRFEWLARSSGTLSLQ
jgi:ABC-2 type transport system permease protein